MMYMMHHDVKKSFAAAAVQCYASKNRILNKYVIIIKMNKLYIILFKNFYISRRNVYYNWN